MGEAILQKQVSLTIKNSDGTYIWEKSYPKGINFKAEMISQPLFHILDQTVRKYPQNISLSFLGHEYTYQQLGILTDKIAKGLQDLGIGKGRKVGLFMPNSAYSVAFYYGILKSGATVVNYNPLYAERDLKNQIEDSETDIMVCLDVENIFNKLDALLPQTRLEKIILCPMQTSLLNSHKTDGFPADETHLWFDDLIKNDGNFVPAIINPDDDIAVLQYTGGTTGVPKGAMLTHSNLYANTIQAAMWWHTAEEGKDAQVAALPFFHVFAMTVVMNMSIIKGLKIIIMPQFDLKEALTLIHEQKPQFFAAVPAIYNAMGNYPSITNYDFSSLKFCLSGGAPLPGDVKRTFETNTKANRVAEGYGLTECSPVATCNPLSGTMKIGSIGLPIPGTVVEIIDPEDKSTVLPLGEKGEICISGPQVMKGYYKRPEATTETIINDRLHTGDIGYIDDEGFIYIVDRIKDLILVRGYNVYPRHVEEAIYLHPSVAECLVAGVPDKGRGEAVHAWVKPMDGHDLTASELKTFLKDKVSTIEMPRKIIIREEALPKTAVGKLSRKDLLEQEGIKK